MITFVDHPKPLLTIGDNEFTGIKILQVLHNMDHDINYMPEVDRGLVKELLTKVALYFRYSSIPTIGFKLCDEHSIVPSKNAADVGYDLTIISVYKQISDSITMYETGVALDIPLGYYVEMFLRSSMSKTGYILANGTGIIDPGYTGTVKVVLLKADKSMPDISLPLRAAQLILKPYAYSRPMQVTELPDTERGTGGFGSTNVPN